MLRLDYAFDLVTLITIFLPCIKVFAETGSAVRIAFGSVTSRNICKLMIGALIFGAKHRLFDCDNLTFNVTIADSAVASVELQGAKLIFKGLQQGVTSAVIKASDGKSYNFTITVRKGANDNGWL